MFAPVPDWLSMPFHYGTLVSHRLFVPVDPARVANRAPGFRPSVHEGRAFVSLDLQLYTANSGSVLARTAEIELCLLGAPDRAPRVDLSLEAFLAGADETRTLGLYRLQVPCDNRFAIDAGIALFGEHKYEAGIRYAVPSPNVPAFHDVRYTLSDLAGRDVLDVRIGLDAPATPCATGAIVRYSHLDGALVGSRWDLYGDLRWRRVTSATLIRGEGDLPFMADLPLLDGAPVALQSFDSRPAAVEGRAFRV